MEPAKRITTFSSRQFNQDTSRAKAAARHGPVLITDRGRPAHVLLTIDDYLAMVAGPTSIVDLLAMPGAENVEFEPGRVGPLQRPPDLS